MKAAFGFNLVLALFVMQLAGVAVSAEQPLPRKAVLVTGANSGIGLNVTRRLAADGYFVYAGARSEKDLAALNEIENVQSVLLDVTYPEHIDAAVASITKAGRGLYGVVNNAGVAMIGPLIETDIEELEWLFDVNVYGPYRITKAFAPLLLEARGRIVNISSISGVLSGPFMGQYSMSKHAIEAYTDSLASELWPLGVMVSAVEPGNFNSGIGETIRRRLDEGAVDRESSLFRDRLGFLEAAIIDRTRFAEPDAVSAAVARALSDEIPQRRYMVAPSQQSAELTIKKAIEELVQLNQNHPYSYDRDQLVQMLDETLQRSRLEPH